MDRYDSKIINKRRTVVLLDRQQFTITEALTVEMKLPNTGEPAARVQIVTIQLDALKKEGILIDLHI
jgi:hypothetical protein